jgi:hypothetical protein
MGSTSISQLFTLIGVVLGVVLSYVTRSLADRAGFRHDIARRWEDRKLDVYTQYVNDVKDVAGISRGIAGTRELQDRHAHLSLAEGIPLLDEAENRRERSTELLTLLANRETIRAYRQLNQAVGRLESFARGTPADVKASEWDQAIESFENALDQFYVNARAELGVPEEYLPLDRSGYINPEDWIKDVRSSAN